MAGSSLKDHPIALLPHTPDMGITPLGFRDYVFNARAILLNAKEMPFSFNARSLQLIHWRQVTAAALSKTAILEAQGTRVRRRLVNSGRLRGNQARD